MLLCSFFPPDWFFLLNTKITKLPTPLLYLTEGWLLGGVKHTEVLSAHCLSK